MEDIPTQKLLDYQPIRRNTAWMKFMRHLDDN